MRRTEVLQGVRTMKFEEVHDRFRRGRLSVSDAAEWLGVAERTVRRWRGWYEAEGPGGVLDPRLGKGSAPRLWGGEGGRGPWLYPGPHGGGSVVQFHQAAVGQG